MNVSVLRSSRRVLSRGAALIILGGLSAGCSSGAMRFSDGVDGIFTGSTPNQKAILSPQSQPFPADQSQVAATPVGGAPSGQVSRGGALPPPDAVASTAAADRTVQEARAEEIRPLAAENPPQQVAAAESARAVPDDDADGWSRAGGTQITAKEGETVFNLSRRFGVPADAIVEANGLSEGRGLRAGQKVIIPTYVYSAEAGVSAPDANPDVAEAKSSRGTKFDIPADKVPVPGEQGERLAVLPSKPKLKEGEAAAAEAASTEQPKVAGAGGTYTVVEGDSLSRISRKTGVDVAALKQANGLQDGIVRIGQTLKLPGGGTEVAAAKVDPVTTGTAAAEKKEAAQPVEVAAYTPPKKTRIAEQVEQDDSAAPDATGIGRMRWPVRGRVISSYGKSGGRSNDGIDIQVPEGTPVKAAENGVVIYAGDGLKEFGNTVLVRHEDGLVTVYGHASELKVSRGDKVKRGQEIALSGMSGSTDAPKLHFEVRKNSTPVDPSTYLE